MEIDPNHLVALKMLGDILEEEGNVAEASQKFNTLLKLEPNNEEIFRHFMELRDHFTDLGNPIDAIELEEETAEEAYLKAYKALCVEHGKEITVKTSMIITDVTKDETDPA